MAKATDLGPLDAYRAYEGPSTAGYSVDPAVDTGGVSDLQRLMIGGAGRDVDPRINMLLNQMPSGGLPPLPDEPPKKRTGKAEDLGPLDAYAGPQMDAPAAPPTMPSAGLPPLPEAPMSPDSPLVNTQPPPLQMAPDVPDTGLVNETGIEKGKAPVQLNADQAGRFALLENIDKVQKARAEQAAPHGVGGFINNFARQGVKTIWDNALALPSIAADLTPGRMVQNAYKISQGQPVSYTPRIHMDDIAAARDAYQKGIPFNQARSDIDIQEGARAKERTESTMLGTVGGDLATMLAGRIPIAKTLVEATRSPHAWDVFRRAVHMTPASTKRQMLTAWANPKVQTVVRGVLKGAETGAEGSILALFHEGDPVKTGAAAASAQLLGSLALTGIKHPLYALGPIAAATVLWQQLKNIIPGGRDRILESAEHAVQVSAATTVVGAVASLFGPGRYRGSAGVIPFSKPKYPVYAHEYARNMPEFAEGVNLALRNTPTSLLQQFINDEKGGGAPVIGKVMSKMSTDVSAFTDAELRRIGRVIRKNGDLRSEIQYMLQSPTKNADGLTFAERMK